MGMVESTVYPSRDHAGTLLKCGFALTGSGMGHDLVFPASSQEMSVSTLEIIPKSYGWVCRGVWGGRCHGNLLECGRDFPTSLLRPLRCKSTTTNSFLQDPDSHLFEMQIFRVRKFSPSPGGRSRAKCCGHLGHLVSAGTFLSYPTPPPGIKVAEASFSPSQV